MNVLLRKGSQMVNAIKPSYCTNIWRAASIQPPRQPVRENNLEKFNMYFFRIPADVINVCFLAFAFYESCVRVP